MNGEGKGAEGGLGRARICAAASLILLVAVLTAGGLRSASERPSLPEGTMAPARESISAFASDRDALRREEMEALEEIAEDENTPQALRAAAQQRRMRLMEWMELEATVSAVLEARGYDTPVVTVHEDSVNIVVRSQGLTQEEAEVIGELTVRETGVEAGNVKIIPIN